MLKSLILLPLLGLIFPKIEYKNKEIPLGLITSILILYFINYLYLTINNNIGDYQYRELIEIFGNKIILGLDGLNISLLLIIGIIFPIVILLNNSTVNTPSYNELEKTSLKSTEKEIIRIILVIEMILLLVFLVLDILYFFIFFEIILIPMFILVGKFGSKTNRIEAAFRFLIYTMIGSLMMFLAIIFLYYKFGTTSLEILNYKISNLFINNFTPLYSEKSFLSIIWFLIFFSFFIKVPIFPFHTWLPTTHTEAPTIGSIILAAILLKLGTYGIFKFNINLFNLNYLLQFNSYFNIYESFIPLIIMFSLLSIYYCSILTIRSIDLKRIIAYSSIVHINYSIFTFFVNDCVGLNGCLFLLTSHAYISGALFLLIGILYIRYHTRILYNFRSLSNLMPIFSFFFFFFTIANSSIPLTSSFISEMFILFSSIKYNLFLSFILSFSLIFSTVYSFWLLIKILYNQPNPLISSYLDLSFNEILSLLPFFFFTLYLGLNPTLLTNLFTLPIINVLY